MMSSSEESVISNKRCLFEEDEETEETVFDAINRYNKKNSLGQRDIVENKSDNGLALPKRPKVKHRAPGLIRDSTAVVIWNPPYIFETDPIDLSKHDLTYADKMWMGKQLANSIITMKALASRFNISMEKVRRINTGMVMNRETKDQTSVTDINWVGDCPFKLGEYDLRGRNVTYDEKLWIVTQLNSRVVTWSVMSDFFHLSRSTIDSFKSTINKGRQQKDPGDTLENIKWMGGFDQVPFHQPLKERYHFTELTEAQIVWVAEQMNAGIVSKNKLSKLLHVPSTAIDRCVVSKQNTVSTIQPALHNQPFRE
jgi:hypothetical protein